MRLPPFLTGPAGRILTFVCLIVLSAGGYKVASTWLQQQLDDVHWLSAQPDCQLGQQPCQFSDKKHTLEVMTSVSEFETDTPFELVVTLDQLPAEKVWVQLEGVEMFMGITRYLLHPRDDGRYSVTLRLPTCTEKSMTWRGHVMAQVEEQTFGTRFEFETIQR